MKRTMLFISYLTLVVLFVSLLFEELSVLQGLKYILIAITAYQLFIHTIQDKKQVLIHGFNKLFAGASIVLAIYVALYKTDLTINIIIQYIVAGLIGIWIALIRTAKKLRAPKKPIQHTLSKYTLEPNTQIKNKNSIEKTQESKKKTNPRKKKTITSATTSKKSSEKKANKNSTNTNTKKTTPKQKKTNIKKTSTRKKTSLNNTAKKRDMKEKTTKKNTSSRKNIKKTSIQKKSRK